jgi:outer membrane scaffolding protein for murein synthesis (MipA/OmpV family)
MLGSLQNYLNHTFGVGVQESRITAEPIFMPGGGLKSAGFGTNATCIIGEHWFLDGVAAATSLLGPAASSPTVQEKMQYALSLSLAYDFR